MEKEIIEYLIAKYNPVALVLSGSRASGKAGTLSDWDIYLFSETIEIEGEWEPFFKDQILEVTPLSLPADKSFVLKSNYHPEPYLKILFDRSGGVVEDVVKRTLEAYRKGPSAPTDREKKLAKKVLEKYIKKVQNRASEEGVVFYYLSLFYIHAVRYWFEMERKWALPVHEALPIIEKEDFSFYAALKILYSPASVQDKIKAAEDISFRVDELTAEK